MNFHLCLCPLSNFFMSLCLCNSRLQQCASHNSVSRYIDTSSTECDSEVAFRHSPRVVQCTIDHTGHVLHARTDRDVYVSDPCICYTAQGHSHSD